MNKEKKNYIKLIFFVVSVLFGTVLLMQLNLNKLEILKTEKEFGKYDVLATKLSIIDQKKIISSDDVSLISIYKEYPNINYVSLNNKKIDDISPTTVDKNFFDMNSIELNGSLIDNNVVISERLAKYLDVGIGDDLIYKNFDGEKENNGSYRISGIYKNKLYTGDSEKIYFKSSNSFENESNILLKFKKNINIKNTMHGLKINSKVIYNDFLVEANARYSNLKEKIINMLVGLCLLIIGIVILNFIYDKREREIIGILRMIGCEKKSIIHEYIKGTVLKIVPIQVFSFCLVIALSSVLKKFVFSIDKWMIESFEIYIALVYYVFSFILLFLVEYLYVYFLVKKQPLEILKGKEKKSSSISRIYIPIKNIRLLFIRYYTVDIIKNICMIFLISLCFIYFFSINYEHRMNISVYNQYKKFEGNDYDFRINMDESINFMNGFDQKILKDLKQINDIEYLKYSRNAYGFVEIGKDTKFDRKFFDEIGNASGYMKNIMRGMVFDYKGSTYIKSEILGVSDEYLNMLEGNLVSGDLKNLDMERNIALYIPTFGEEEAYKLEYKVGDEIELCFPGENFTAKKFGDNIVDSDSIKNKFKVVAILKKPPVESDIYTGSMSIMPVMKIKQFNSIVGNDVIRELKIKFDSSVPLSLKEKTINKIYEENFMYGINITNYSSEQDKVFENLKKELSVKNILVVLIFIISLFITMVNIIINNNKRTNDYNLLNIIGVTQKKIKKFIIIESFINYFISANIVLLFGQFIARNIYRSYTESGLLISMPQIFDMLIPIYFFIVISGFLVSIIFINMLNRIKMKVKL